VNYDEEHSTLTREPRRRRRPADMIDPEKSPYSRAADSSRPFDSSMSDYPYVVQTVNGRDFVPDIDVALGDLKELGRSVRRRSPFAGGHRFWIERDLLVRAMKEAFNANVLGLLGPPLQREQLKARAAVAGDPAFGDTTQVGGDPCHWKLEDEPQITVAKGEYVRYARTYTVVIEKNAGEDCQEGYKEASFTIEGAFCLTEAGLVTEQTKPTATPHGESDTRGGSVPK